MRRPTKASSAGSTSGQASRLGSFFGAFAVRDGSLRGDGSGASSIGQERSGLRARLVLAALLAAATYLVLAAGSATPLASAATCSNAVFRTGASANLPDCRAYELVSPPNPGGHRPTISPMSVMPDAFESPLITASANDVIFQTIDGAYPGTFGSGFEDRYRSVRGADGWTTELAGPTAAESERSENGAASPDHEYQPFVYVKYDLAPNEGTLLSQLGLSAQSNLLRLPGNTYQVLGMGSLGVDPDANGKWITAGATHIIFQSYVQLESNAPPSGTAAVYDRSADGPAHVVSLLPGDVTPGDWAFFAGVSLDGTAVAFTVGGTLYVRVDNADTYSTGSSTKTFAGLGAEGKHLFYVQGGDVFSFETATQAITQVTSVGNAQVTNISEDGSHVYFVSTSQIGGHGTASQPNLYAWERATETIKFIATLDPQDVTDLHPDPELQGDQNLVNWVSTATAPAKDTLAGAAGDVSRTTPDGSVIVFESKAELTAYDNAGHREIYRYDANADSLACVSCGPGAGSATGDASLQSFVTTIGDEIRPLTVVNPVANLSDDGQTVVFESTEQLAAGDTRDTRDVYRWKDGDLALISSGKSPTDNYLYTATDSGSDVVFLTVDRLLPQDNSSIGALYDARVDGGFPLPESFVTEPCVGDACQGQLPGTPGAAGIGSSLFGGAGNANETTRSTISGLRKLSSSDRSTLAKGGKARLRLKVSGSGTVTVTGTAKVGKKKHRVVSASAKSKKAGAVSVRFALSRSARAELRRKRSLTVRLTVRFRDARPKVVSVTLRSAASKKGGRS